MSYDLGWEEDVVEMLRWGWWKSGAAGLVTRLGLNVAMLRVRVALALARLNSVTKS